MCIPAAQAGAKSISRFRRKFAAMEVAQIHFGGEDLPLADCKPTLYSVSIIISVNIIHNVAKSCQKSEPGSNLIFLDALASLGSMLESESVIDSRF